MFWIWFHFLSPAAALSLPPMWCSCGCLACHCPWPPLHAVTASTVNAAAKASMLPPLRQRCLLLPVLPMLLPASMLPLLHHYLACFCCTYSCCNYHLNTITAHAADAAVAAASMLPPLILSPHPTTDVAAFTGVLLMLLSHCCTCHLTNAKIGSKLF